ncbi:MAG: diguanylate cyclase [Treponema sp.]|nr:diguanylate cyclase [Treponema sp.]
MSKKSTILAIDDEPITLIILETILTPDWNVITAESGEEGLKKSLAVIPDLILLDIMMPGMNGFDTLKILKESVETQNIPVIIITVENNDATEEKCFNLGAVDFISKPFSSVVVRARVKNQLQIVNQFRTIERLGLIDPLTNIRNRRSFNDRLNTEWRRCLREKAPLSFLMIDVDKFKDYNDTYGHPQGDTLLKTLAMIFESSARRPADIIARLGGEEFGLLLPNTSLKPATEIAENIRESVEALRVLTADGRTDTKITISIGVAAIVPTEDLHAEDLICKADENLYMAKASGRNRVCSGKN